jgi:hypothetical protein
MAMSASDRGKCGFAALVKKYGHGKAVYIVRMASNDKTRRLTNGALSNAQEHRETVRGWEAEARKRFGKWY